MLLVLGTNTWLAYNDFGGSNLYTGSTHASWDRPLATGSPRQAAGRGPSRCGREPARSAHGRARRLHRARAPHAMGRFGGLAELRGAVPRVGRARGVRDRRRDQRRPRTSPRPARRRHADALRRSRRVLVEPATRRGRGARRARRQPRGAVGQHVLLAGPLRRRRSHDGRLQAALRRRPGIRHRSASTCSRRSGPTARSAGRRPRSPACRSTAAGTRASARRVPRGSGGYTVHRPEHWVFDGCELRVGRPARGAVHRRRLRVRRLRVHARRRPARADARRRLPGRLRDPRELTGRAVRPANLAATRARGRPVGGGVPRVAGARRQLARDAASGCRTATR